MSMKISGNIVRVLLLFVLPALLGQMPDWKYFKDRQGNTYFLDRAGKIRITNLKRYGYRPVSASGIDYYIEYATSLIQEHRPLEGISVLKSICALPSDNNRVLQAQVRATEILNTLKKKNGPRYSAMNESASLIIFSNDGATTVINDLMRYTFQAPGRIDVVRKRDRAGSEYRYSGIQFGARASRNAAAPGDAYDFLIAVDSEKFSVPIRDLSHAVEQWRGNVGDQGLTRQVLEQKDDRVIYLFRSGDRPGYTGIEGIYVIGCYSHYVRLIASDSGYREDGGIMRKIIGGFRTVTERR